MLRRRAAQHLFGVRQVVRERIGEPEIGEHRGLVGNDLERSEIITLRFGVVPHLVEHGALRGEDAPVGLVGRVGAAEHVERLLIIAVFRKRAAVFAEHGLVVRVADRCPLQHGQRLGALSGGTQRLRIAQCDVEVRRVGTILLPIDREIAAPVGIGPIVGRRQSERAGRCGALRRLAAGRDRGNGNDQRGRGKQACRAGSGRTHLDRCNVAAKTPASGAHDAAAAGVGQQ